MTAAVNVKSTLLERFKTTRVGVIYLGKSIRKLTFHAAMFDISR
jgi:hypothetical protein